MLQQAERDVLPDRQAVEQRGALEQHAELLHDLLARAARRAPITSSPSISIEPRSGSQDAEDALQQHRLAGARAADHHDQLALGDVEIDAVQHLLGAEALVQVADADLGVAVGLALIG